MTQKQRTRNIPTLSCSFLFKYTLVMVLFSIFALSSLMADNTLPTNSASNSKLTSENTNTQPKVTSPQNTEKTSETPDAGSAIEKETGKTQDEINKNQKEEFLKQLKDLENQRRQLSLEIYKLRVKLIKENPDLQSLQRSIMDMHRNMASKLNENKNIKVLLEKANKLDSQIVDVINQNKNLKPEEENTNK